ncbi:15-hydroxyprostaglandin dehydrogenase [NAD(+)]-like [Sabethes cyaneus]|uniref:15-hydroxyprostaglandin dehydrogenase [NAD(+)]-like n=1 Tax=Sabethes cyaneus TaxID=53552 RepID=UPI00237DA4E4|nr:15-hydroxyprostaglandin dehydrogenase [NAD(+)]-like [Sabethes cyaneus]
MSKLVLNNKTAVITGAANGIGFATTEELLKNGVSKVLLLDKKPELTEKQYAQLEACNSEADIFYVRCDVTDKQQLEFVFYKYVLDLLGSFDILVNSVGVWELDSNKCIDVNLIGSMHCTLLAIDVMNKEKGGTGGFIVNITNPETTIYTEETYGMAGFTRTLGTESMYNKTGIKLTAICPSIAKSNIMKALVDSSASFLLMKEIFELIKKFGDGQTCPIGKSIVKVIMEKETGSVWLSSSDTENDTGYRISEIKFELNKYV